MTTLLLVRHGRTPANASGVLAGWTPGVHLDDHGTQQAAALASRLLPVPVAAVVTSPLERCRETAAAIGAGRDGTPEHVDDRIGECHYGDWTGKALKDLTKDPMWRVVQAHPSAAVFPGPDGESMRAMAARAVDAVRDWNARLGPDATYVAVSHGDVIKAIVADALAVHLDQFQRIQVDPCSLTVIRYTELRPFVVRLNDTGGSVDSLLPPKKKPRRSRRSAAAESDAAVGGGAGT
ncbi:MAG TPA: histidine phosphatase family protein [Actinomycetes bacterium]